MPWYELWIGFCLNEFDWPNYNDSNLVVLDWTELEFAVLQIKSELNWTVSSQSSRFCWHVPHWHLCIQNMSWLQELIEPQSCQVQLVESGKQKKKVLYILTINSKCNKIQWMTNYTLETVGCSSVVLCWHISQHPLGWAEVDGLRIQVVFLWSVPTGHLCQRLPRTSECSHFGHQVCTSHWSRLQTCFHWSPPAQKEVMQ